MTASNATQHTNYRDHGLSSLGIGVTCDSEGAMDLEKANSKPDLEESLSLSSSKRRENTNNGIDSTNASGAADDTTATSLTSLGRRDTVQIIRLRRLVFGIMTLCMIGISYGSYHILHQWQVSHLENAFHDEALKVIDSFHWKLQRKLHVMSSLSTSITSYVKLKQSSGSAGVDPGKPSMNWPMVSVPDYHIIGASSRTLADAVSVSFCPLVTEETREDWEKYSIDHANGWIDAGSEFEQKYKAQESKRELSALLPTDASTDSVSPHITVLDEDVGQLIQAASVSSESNNKTYYFPLWQSSPIVPELVNYDMGSNGDFKEGIQAMVATQQAVLGKVSDFGDKSKSHAVLEQIEQHWQHQNQGSGSFKVAYGHDPVSKLYFPVFEDLLETRDNGKNLVGMITAVVFWETYMTDVLPPDTPPVTVVLHNECDADDVSYTYQIHGQDVTYMGRAGDYHDEINIQSFHSQSITSDLSLVTDRHSIDNNDHYDGVASLNHDFCPYKLKIYPTHDMANEFLTDFPFYFAAVIVGIFLFPMCMIRCYDWQVDTRQTMVMEQVAKSNALITSIFPAEVRDRLYNKDSGCGMANCDGQRQSKVSFQNDFQKTKIKNFLYSGDDQNAGGRKSSMTGPTVTPFDLISSNAIVDEFEVSGVPD